MWPAYYSAKLFSRQLFRFRGCGWQGIRDTFRDEFKCGGYTVQGLTLNPNRVLFVINGNFHWVAVWA